jgi:hypothetical protein
MNPTQERRSRRTGRASARARVTIAESKQASEPKVSTEEVVTRSKRNAGEKRDRLNSQVAAELKALRASLTQCLDAIDLRVGGGIAEMLQILEGEESLDSRPRPLTVKAAQAALEDMAALQLSKKGRPRDLRRIEKLVRRLRAALPA